jgi:hypothetical protein
MLVQKQGSTNGARERLEKTTKINILDVPGTDFCELVTSYLESPNITENNRAYFYRA